MQLSASVATQVEAARAGMALLDKAHKTLSNMQNSYMVAHRPADIARLPALPQRLAVHNKSLILPLACAADD